MRPVRRVLAGMAALAIIPATLCLVLGTRVLFRLRSFWLAPWHCVFSLAGCCWVGYHVSHTMDSNCVAG